MGSKLAAPAGSKLAARLGNKFTAFGVCEEGKNGAVLLQVDALVKASGRAAGVRAAGVG